MRLDHAGRARIAELIDAAETHLESLREMLVDETSGDADVRAVATRFCRMNDDAQARVLVEVARIMGSWPSPPSFGMGWQAHAIGRHLRDCECSTEEGRQLVREIAAAMEGEPER